MGASFVCCRIGGEWLFGFFLLGEDEYSFGVMVRIIAAQTLADCLRDIGDLRLLHFGTCLVAGGEIPGKIQKLLGESATFPISGYANAADWGGSAMVDFTYFELMFSRHLSPAEAIEQTKRMLTFAGASSGRGCDLAGGSGDY